MQYDSLGRVICSQEITNGALHQGTETLYDDANRVQKQSWSLFQTEGGKTTTKTYTGRYTYNTGNGTMATADFGTGRTATFAYDNLQRLTSETMAGLYTKNYTYRDISSTRTTTQIASESYTGLCSGWSDRGASYTYDAIGNIATITGPYKNKKSVKRTYTYDAQNQLLSETIGSDTTSYTYDTAGNIRSITGPNVSKTFSYNDTGDWKDLLTSVTVNGTTRSITYEEENGVTIGNPLSYFNGTQYTLAWQNGRQLASLSGGGKSATYTYGADGIRTGKTVTDASGTTTYQYTTQNGQIARQSWTAGGTAYQMDFIYDAAGRPLAMYYRSKTASQTDFNGDSYYYETNQQGDVTGLYKITYNATTKALSATRVASYEYDAWGNVTYSTGTMAKINPLKYRGYYHDVESGFYYLQSRYYDPTIGRFINADGQISLDGSFLNTNQFAYCGNNPVNQVDPEGDDYIRALYRVFRLIRLISNKAYKRLNKRWNAKYDRMSGTSTRNRLINDQNGTTGQTFTYGACYAQWNACETIAVHNAKVLLGIDSTLSDTMAAFQDANAMMAFGYLGSDPRRIGTVLRNEGIQYTRIRLDEMDKPGTYIISFWNDPITEGLHTVTVSYDGGSYTTYNYSGHENDLPSNYASRYICGYYLG